MLEGRKRLAVLAIVFGVLGGFVIGISAAFLSITPSRFFVSPLYWAGALFFFAFSFDIADKRRIPWYSRLVLLGALVLSLLAGKYVYPDAYGFFYGFVGFFPGFGFKVIYDIGFAERRVYCPTCNRKGWVIRKHGKWYCERMGHEVIRGEQSDVARTRLIPTLPSLESTMAMPQASIIPSIAIQGDEKYIGGFTSISLSLGRFYAGYGVYVTDHRIFGLGQRSAGVPETAVELKATIPPQVTEEQNNLIIGELERKKELVILKEEVESMTISRPPGVFRAGHLRIHLQSGKIVDIGIGKMKAYDQLLALMKAFYEQLTVVS